MSRSLTRSAAFGLVVASTVFGLGLAEGGLRIAGFSANALPTLEFGWPVVKVLTDHFVPDRDLFWVPRDYQDTLASARENPPAVVFLGDSCTEWGEYPALAMQDLKTSRPSLTSGVKLGVAGWSSVQGLAQLRRDVIPLHPRVVTIYYGWNDHWRALGPPDGEARLNAVSWWLSQHARVYQLWMKVRLVAGPNDREKRPFRVPLAQYEDNLKEMADLIRKQGAIPVLITAPEGHEAGKEPRYLAQQFVARLSELIPLHTSYVEATRRAASSTGAVLCDAARAFDALPPPKTQYFQNDGIHLSAAGDDRMAHIVSACIAQSVSE